MKINADNKLANLAPAAPATERRAGPSARPSPAAEPSAQVVLSPAAQLASSALASEPGIDAEKVARMSQAIADGSFKVNPDAIADKLIANAREQLAKAYGKTGEL